MNKTKVWLVTGASKGFGLVLSRQLLAAGYAVAATSRDKNALSQIIGNTGPGRFLALDMELTSEDSVQQAIDAVLEKFGRLDVIVNNAGYGQLGALEELSDEEVRRNFDVNVFGSLHVIRKAMPHLRRQGSGHIFNISSIGGYTADFPGWGIYCATKFAVAGFTEALAQESKPFGVKATVVYPGYFRTAFLSGGSLGLPAHPIAEYASVRASQEQHQQAINGNQPGDPEKGMAVLIKAAEAEEAPVHLFLGQDAYEFAALKTASVQKDMTTWEAAAAAATAFSS